LIFTALGEHRLGAEAEVPQHRQGHEGGAAEQQAGLDDLHPRRRRHAAEQHVDHHQRADDHHREPVLEAEQQLDQLAGTDHLRDQVERDHDQRAGGGEDPDRRLREAERGDVGEGELAEVAQRSAMRKVITGQPTRKPIEKISRRSRWPSPPGRDAEERRRRHGSLRRSPARSESR
jgi:hypothetical protein